MTLQNIERNLRMYEERKQLIRLSTLAEKYKLTKERVRQICFLYAQLEQKGQLPTVK